MKSTSILAAVALAACGKSSAQPAAGPTATAAGSPGAPAESAPATGPQNRCEVHVTGDEAFSFVGTQPRAQPGGGKVVAETDYWMSDDELRMALTALAGFSKKSKDEIDAQVDAELKRDPRFVLLLVNCSVDGQGFLDLSPGKGSRYEDVPFKPGTYRIAAGHDNNAGVFNVMVSIQPGGKHEGFAVSEPGTLELTRFDETGIAGTFTFKAKSYSGGHAVSVTGSFDYGCGAGARCRR